VSGLACVSFLRSTAKALLLFFALFATNAIAQTGTPSDFNAGLVPVAPNGPELVGWRTVPSPAQISEVFPADATYSGYTLWECQILVDGRLSDCALQTQWPPNDERYKVAAEKLLPIFRIDSHAIELAAREHKRVLFDLPVYREGSKTFPPGECPPPFCVPVLPPPPIKPAIKETEKQTSVGPGLTDNSRWHWVEVEAAATRQPRPQGSACRNPREPSERVTGPTAMKLAVAFEAALAASSKRHGDQARQ